MKYHGPFRWMSGFKAVQADYEYFLSLSDKPESVCLSERQRYLISVQNTYSYWFTRWYNTDDTSAAEVAAIAAEIEELMMCGCGVPEPSIQERIVANTYMTETNTFYEETYNTWNDAGQTVVSIAPNLDFDTGSPADIDNVTCLAIAIFLDTIIQAAIAYKQKTTQEKRDITKNLASVFAALASAGGAAIAAGGVLALGMAYLGGPLTVFGLAAAAVGLFIANIVETTDLSVLQDEDAIRAVLCVLKKNMLGETLTQSRFIGALSPHPWASGSNADKLAAIVQPYLDDQNVYLQFLIQGQGLYDAVELGSLPDCDMCLPHDCFDFTVDDQLWTTPTTITAQYTPATGWGQDQNTYLTIDSPVQGSTIHTVTIKFSRAWAGANDFDKFFVHLYDWGGTGNSQVYPVSGLLTGDEVTVTTTGADWIDLRVQVVAGGLTFPPNGSNPTPIYIESICYNPE